MIIYTQFTIFILVTIVFIFLGLKMIKKNKEDFEPMEYAEVMEIINKNIEVQFQFKYALEYQLKDIKIIYDYEKEMKEITSAVLLSFSSDFYRHIDYYHDREYIYKYVSKRVNISLMKFSDKIKPKTK